jgi:hypothetical protein
MAFFHGLRRFPEIAADPGARSPVKGPRRCTATGMPRDAQTHACCRLFCYVYIKPSPFALWRTVFLDIIL